MVRIKRSDLATFTFFHVCTKGNGGQNIFVDDKDYRRYLTLLEKYRLRFKLQCFAYCLMTNHVHLLVLSPSVAALSKAVHALHVGYVMYFNKRYQRSGHLLQDRFSSWVIRDEKHLIHTKDYIENNPVNSGMVSAKRGYPWSSAGGDGSIVSIAEIRV